jgi:hypothetical protein
MFNSGFEKTALQAKFIGKGLGYSAKGARAVGQHLKRVAAGKTELQKSIRAGKEEVMRAGKSEPGEKLLQKHIEKFTSGKKPHEKLIPGETKRKLQTVRGQKEFKEAFREKAKQRLEKMEESKPTFMHKHPLLTAGGAVLAYKSLFGEKDSEQKQFPSITYPQQY